MMSEVRTLRAYYYMNLAIFFGDVPLVTQLLTIAEANSVFQAPRNEVFDFVEKELKESAEVLPPTRPDSENGRITTGLHWLFWEERSCSIRSGKTPKIPTGRSWMPGRTR